MQSKPLAFLAAGAVAALIAAGCSGSKDQSTSTSTTTTESSPAAGGGTTTSSSGSTTTASTAGAGAMGDASKGKQIFSANCSSCHGATGTEGGVGPSLKGEKNRKNYQQTIAWIKNPQPPMPKLYPSPLSETDVDNVAAYVQSL